MRLLDIKSFVGQLGRKAMRENFTVWEVLSAVISERSRCSWMLGNLRIFVLSVLFCVVERRCFGLFSFAEGKSFFLFISIISYLSRRLAGSECVAFLFKRNFCPSAVCLSPASECVAFLLMRTCWVFFALCLSRCFSAVCLSHKYYSEWNSFSTNLYTFSSQLGKQNSSVNQ